MAISIEAEKACVLVLPFPVQGHINPMLQLSKLLASKGLEVTLATTIFVTKIPTTIIQDDHESSGSVTIEPVSDGCDNGGADEAGSIETYLERLESIWSQNIEGLIENKNRNKSKRPYKCIIYDSVIPWALKLSKKFGSIGVAFYTQSCAVDAIYYNVYRGSLQMPVQGSSTLSLPGLPSLEIHELPSFVYEMNSYPCLLELYTCQIANLDNADWVLFNTYIELETEVVKWLAQQRPLRMITVGPTVPCIDSSKCVKSDISYGLNLFKPDVETCMNWLNAKEIASVIYVSFGSLAALEQDQMEELAWGLKKSGKNFLWVVRASEEDKLPNTFKQETYEKGLVVTWCNQLEVLAHAAIGCFLTHCGWNSVLEALCYGVPMVAMPQWTDQTTNTKFVEDIWKVGIRVKRDGEGMVTRDEVELCIRVVMEGEKRVEVQSNAAKWKMLAKQAREKGGSSSANVDDFVSAIMFKRMA